MTRIDGRKHKLLLVPFHQHLSALYEGLIDKGCEITGLIYKSHLQSRTLGRVQFEPMRIFVGYPLIFYRWFKIGFQAPKYVFNFSKKVKKLKPSVLVVFDLYHWYFLQALWIKYNNPTLTLILYSETKRYPKRKAQSFLLHFFLKRAQKYQVLLDGVLVYTEDGKRFLESYINSEKIHIVPAPVETKLFKKDNQTEANSCNPKLRILCNARFETYKNHDDLLAAVRLLINAGYQCQLTLIGRAESGKERVEKLVSDKRLGEHVIWLDSFPIEAMPDLYRAHDVLVLPSYNEAIGMVVPEAMACGIPTITSDTVGANVYVVPNQTGLIFKTGDVEALVATLKYYIDFPEARARHGQTAAIHIKTNYSVEKITERFLQLVGVG